MKILLIEPFFEGSHQAWALGYQQHSQAEVRILSLPGRHWKWRMYGGAVSLAKLFMEMDFQPDLLLATDMLDLATFLALTRSKSAQIPTAIYFHENQITYPWSPTDADVALQRNNQYGFINYTSALVADAIFFNSQYHLQSFTEALPAFLQQFPDFKEVQNVALIQAKSQVLYLGMDLQKLAKYQVEKETAFPLILWNHRWEYDKNPDLFFQTLFQLTAENIDFKLVVLGARYHKVPPIFTEAKERLQKNILHWGYADTYEDYAHWLWRANIFPVTSHQDFFGGSVVEALYSGAFPLLPQRLAYPEHIPTSLHSQYFYATPDQFFQKLKNAIQLFDVQREKVLNNGEVQNFVSRYDWITLRETYDKALSNNL